MSQSATISTHEEHTRTDAPVGTSNANTAARCNVLQRAAARLQGQKRKRDTEIPYYESQARPFLIRCPQQKGDDALVSISPQFLLSRLHLPLSSLDTIQPAGALALPRIFSSNIKPLENVGPSNSTVHGPLVLVASIGSLDCLCAIERVQPQSYSLVKLGSWVPFDDLHKYAITFDEADSTASKKMETGRWVRVPDVAVSLPDGASNGMEALGCSLKPEHDVVANRAGLLVDANSNITSSLPFAPTESHTPQQSLGRPSHVDRDQSIAGVLQHYLETLYVTQTPLAYFAKGPISRARAAFSGPSSNESQADELWGQLKQFVFSIKLLDIKHQQSLPATVGSYITSESFIGGSFVDASTSPRHIARKLKRMKPDKKGFFVEEASFLRKWCTTQEKKTTDVTSREDVRRRLHQCLTKIKTREYLLQLILILEGLALNALGHVGNVSECDDMKHRGRANTDKKTTANIKQDATTKSLFLSMEALLDRLSIWQSLSTERSVQESESQGLEPGIIASNTKSSSTSSDVLQDFCTDVVIPFYQSRIPSITKDVMKRMGVTLKSPVIEKSKLLPGQTVKSQSQRTRMKKEGMGGKQHNTLKRVASDTTQVSKRRPPTLSRFSTDPLLKGTDRGRSATPQSLQDLHQRARRPLSRASSISQGNGLGHREVDFSSITKFKQSKYKKPTNVEAELKDAIATLKKPNRDLAVKEFFETQETVRSRPSVGSFELPQKTSSHQRFIHDAQVEATPKRIQRSRGDVAITSNSPSVVGSCITANSGACISSSAEKPSYNNFIDKLRRTDQVSNTNDGNEDHKKDLTDLVKMPLSRRLQYDSPTTRAETPIDRFSNRNDLNRRRLQPTKIAEPGDIQPNSRFVISATPSKIAYARPFTDEKENMPKVLSASEVSFEADVNSECIYDALGWNNDTDELM